MAVIKTIRCMVVTPEAQVVDTEAYDIILPAHDGLLGVLPGHAPFLCKLGSGLVSYHDGLNKMQKIYIEGGFGHVHHNEVTLLTNRAITTKQVNSAQAREQLRQAESLPKSTIEQVQARSEAIRRAKHLVKLTS